MSPQFRLILASIVFAVLWTAGMSWWIAPPGDAEAIALALSGALAGCLWYVSMRWSSNAITE